MFPYNVILLAHAGFESIAQLSVAFNLKRNEASKVCGFAGNGKVPKSQTIEPVAPKLGSK